MNAIPYEERKRMGEQLAHTAQDAVMAQISQFFEAEVWNSIPAPAEKADTIHTLVFNMERGTHLTELGDFLQTCPDVFPCDVILANELDDGCLRTGQKNTTRELAERLGMNYVFGLEFIELAEPQDSKGYHGNAIFSRWPIRRAEIVRLPEQYNWYFDKQRRIGGRLAILAELDVNGRSVCVGTIHLENRTHSEGRRIQLETILKAVDRSFSGMPVILGGDLNTNTFDGRDKNAIRQIAGSEALQRRCLEDVFAWEACLPLAQENGYCAVPNVESGELATRRKPLPEGGALELRLDWRLLRGLRAGESRNISTCRTAWTFAAPGSALGSFTGSELSDHNAVWAACGWDNNLKE